ncbi:MAG TPA: endonuclease III [Methanoregulaceae archaeon]|nr:endonuclease III [Methanoregulaceae archaeon]HQJ87600.1 endonuclease III [Methanoregulaceae archaeon]
MDAATCSCILSILEEAYPHACNPQDFFSDPFQVLVLTILSAQTTDAQVWALRAPLFSRYPTPLALAQADLLELEALIRPTGYYHAKARHLLGAARMLVDEFGGRVPDTMDELVRLPGVGRKTANIVLFHAFGKNEGVAVDTHVLRLARRIGYTDHSDPIRVERDLMACHSPERWGALTDLLIAHGRAVCTARRPRCGVCPISRFCRYFTREGCPPQG